MNQLFLHVGAHKTGSSSIQNTLEMNRERLFENGIRLYPGRNHSEFYRAFTDTPECFHRYYRSWNKDAGQQQLRIRLKNYFLANTDIDHFISGEDICLLSESALAALSTFLRHECNISKINVVCFLREPLDYLNSSLQQYIKPGLVTLDEIVSNTLNSYCLQGCPEFSGGLQNVLTQIYFPIPLKLVKVFGKEHVQFIKFETAVKTGLVSSAIGNFKNFDLLDLDDERPSNTSISHEACLLLAEYNNRNPLLLDSMDINRRRVASRIVSVIRSIPGGPARLIDPSHLDFEKVNSLINQINSIANFEVLTPIHELPEKYRKNVFFTFSRESMAFLDTLIDTSGLKVLEHRTIHNAEDITEINRSLEKAHGFRWWSLLNKYKRMAIS